MAQIVLDVQMVYWRDEIELLLQQSTKPLATTPILFCVKGVLQPNNIAMCYPLGLHLCDGLFHRKTVGSIP